MKIKKILKNKIKYSPRGVSLIEALILIFIFSVVTMSFYSVFAVGTKYILNSKNKIIATSLANERMEMLRNLAYDNVATIAGIPNGPIDPDETVTVGDKTFRVTTDIKYYDDPDDGIFGGVPHDNVPNDYKLAKVIVYWGQESEEERATLSSRFVPPGVENVVGGGTFSINSIDYAGNPVPNVTTNIFNDQLSPVINYTTTTETNGNLLLQGVPGDVVQNYKITMSKSGYETVTTYPPTGAGFIPKDMHSNIIAGASNEKTMVINPLSDLTLKSVDAFGENLNDVSFDLVGGRRLDDGSVEPGFYSYNESVSTDSSAEFSINDVSPGKYMLSNFSFANGDYQFRKVEIGDDLIGGALNLIPGDSFSTNILFMDKNLDSAYIKVIDSSTLTPVVGVSVKLTNTLLGYDVTLVTDKYGYVYFPEAISAPLQNGQTYEITASESAYQTQATDIIINKFTTKEIVLVAN